MILGLSSIREDSREDELGQTPKVTLQKTAQNNLIPALHQDKPIKPFVPEVYSIGNNKRNVSTNIDSFTNVSISKLAALNHNYTYKGARDLEMLDLEELPENAMKNPTSFDLVGLEDLHRINKLSSDKIDSFLEITNKIFKKGIPLMSSLQLTDLINKEANDKVYLPSRRFKFKGINLKHSIAIIGSPESVLNFYEAGFNFAETPEEKEVDLQQTNIKLHDPLKLFNVRGHSCVVSLQNSVVQCSHKNLTSLKQGSRFLHVSSPGKQPIDKIIIQIESSVIQNFDTLLEIEDGVEVDLVHIRICSAKIVKLVKLLDVGSTRINKLKVELIGSFFDSGVSLFTLNSPNAIDITFNAYKNTFIDCKSVIDMKSSLSSTGSVTFLDNSFINGGYLFTFRNIDTRLTFAKCIFKSANSRCFVLESCSQIDIHNCCFIHNKPDYLLDAHNSHLVFFKNAVVDNSGKFMRITGVKTDKRKEIFVHDNRFVNNKAGLIHIDRKAKDFVLALENNVFESKSLPLELLKVSKTAKVIIKSNVFKLEQSKQVILKGIKGYKVEDNCYEYGVSFSRAADNKEGKDFDQAFYSNESEQDIMKLFGDHISAIN